ncbi:oligosaccharide flippase family protein [Clostridium gasigenes]|uniref:lipopolysaccharide biosynthesis protein n=1 Tax=Clostridium gasigenes TaxID=94869 RepID=UPI00162531D5|nr:oligosaccharide flippase family protein [Clostridium gasigenes]MBB6624100.1 oligosaccharide flippase family protein [Clostridium gasigenes]
MKSSNKDNKSYIYNIVSSFGVIIITNIIALISIPISVKYLGNDRYGIWTVISTLLVFLGMSNLGLNESATTLISKNNNFKTKIKIIKKILWVLLVSLIFFTFIFFIVFIKMDVWRSLLGKIPSNLEQEAFGAIVFAGILYLINVPFSLITSIYIGFQKLYLDKMFTMLVSIINFILLIVLINSDGDLITYAIFVGATNILVNVIKIIFFYFRVFKVEKKSGSIEIDYIANEDEISYKNILITSLRFFSVSIAGMIVWNTDNLIITNMLGIEEVSAYSITFKIYNILFTVITIFTASMVPIIGKEIGNGNWEWLRKTYQKLSSYSIMVGGLAWIGGVLFIRDLISIFVGESYYGGVIVVCALGGYSYLLSIVNINASVLKAFNFSKGLALVGWMEAIINFVISITLVKYLGIAGVALGTFLASLFSVAWMLPRMLAKNTNNKIVSEKNFVMKHTLGATIPMLIVSLAIQLFINSTIHRFVFGILVVIIYMGLCYKNLSYASKGELRDSYIKNKEILKK